MIVDRASPVLIADSHRLCRSGLASICRELGVREILCADDLPGVARALESNASIGIAIVDSALPGLTGMSEICSLRVRWPRVRVVVVAWRGDRGQAFEALQAGAHGYVPKDLSDEDMAEALRTVRDGYIYVPSIISEVPETSASASLATVPASGDAVLTTRQREVLDHLTAGLSNKEIAHRLAIAEGTVKVHIAAAFRTLHVHNRVGAAAAMHRLRDAEKPTQPSLPGFDGGPRPPSGPRRRLAAAAVASLLSGWSAFESSVYVLV